MKISCDIIKDVLPLYAEDMVSNATKEMVDEHICDCEGCTRELESLKKTEKLPVETDVSALKRVGDSIRRRRILAVMAVLLFVGTVLIGGALMLDATIYLSAHEAVKDIYVEGDTVKIVWGDQITGTGAASRTEAPGNYAVVAWTRLGNILFPTERIPYEQLADDVKALITKDQYDSMDNISTYNLEDCNAGTNFWYYDPSEDAMELLMDVGNPYPSESLMKVNYQMEAYVVGFAILCIVCILLGRVFRNRWYGVLSERIAILCGSLAVSAVIVTAGQLFELYGAFTEMVVDSTAVAVPMCLFGLCIRQLIKLNRQDKGL